jgi:putative transposase
MIDHGDPELTVEEQAALVGVNRTGLYYRPATPSLEEVALKHQIDAIYTATPFYGSRRITAVLRRAGQMVNRKAVQRHMQEMGIAGIAPGPLTSRPHPTHPIYPYLLRHITADRPNHIWESTSRTSVWSGPGCTWSWSWIGTPGTSSVGNWTNPWSRDLCSPRWIGRSREQRRPL